jgi:Mg-chelatase subunit ChlI
VVAFEHAENAGSSARCIALLTCTRRDEVGDVQLTDVMLQLAIRANSSGRGSGGALARFMEMRLARISAMRGRFDRSLEVDGARRKELVEMIKRSARQQLEYSEEEENIVAEGQTWFKAFDGLKSKDVDMRSPQTKGKVAYKKGDSRAWGWATATARAR